MAFSTERFWLGQPSVMTGNTNLWTCPAGRLAVVTNWRINPTSNVRAFMYAGNSGHIEHNLTVQQTTGYSIKGFWVIHPGETIVFGDNDGTGQNAWQDISGLYGYTGDKIGGGEPIRVYAGTPNVAGAQIVYTVPAGRTLVIKQMDIVSLVPYQGAHCIRIHAVTHLTPLYAQIPPYKAHHHNCSIVVKAGQQISVDTGGANSMNFLINGLLY